MDIKTLTTFLSVAKHKNFSAAARELNSVQPTVSRHISELENELGVKLFLRTTHQVELTPSGEVLLPEAMGIISNDIRVKEKVRSAKEDKLHQIRVGYLATACSFFLPKLIGRFNAENDSTTTNLFEMTGQQQYDALMENRIDVAFSRHQPKLDNKTYHVDEIYSDKLVAILPVAHPLAHKKELELNELNQERFILFEQAQWAEIYQHILSLCLHSGFSPDIAFHPENMRHLVTSVSSGLGISIAPNCIKFIAGHDCVCIPIKQINLVLPLYMYYKRTQNNSSLLTLIKACQTNASDVQSLLN